MVKCVKLGKEAEGLDKPPFRTEFGQRIYENVSREAWEMWLRHSTMFINEFRLDLMSERGQALWMAECENYFFGEGSELPPDFKPPDGG